MRLLALSLCGLLLTIHPVSAAGEPLAVASVPRDGKPRGEVRLFLRDKQVVLQTLLYSRVLKRVLGAIAKKEERFWREKPEAADSQLYIAALGRSFEQVWQEFKARENKSERRQGLMIEFRLGEKGSGLLQIARPELSGEPGTLTLGRSRPLATLQPSRSYLLGSLFEISRDSLNLSPQELLKQIEAAQPTNTWLKNEWTRMQAKENPS